MKFTLSVLFSLSLFTGFLTDAEQYSNGDSLMHHTTNADIEIYRGKDILDIVPNLNAWCIYYYQRFPFLYIAGEEVPPSHRLAEDPTAFVLFAEQKGKKIGLLMAHILSSSTIDVKYSPMAKLNEVEALGFDPGKILYISCFLVVDEERRNGDLINSLYQKAVDIAKEMGLSRICYFTTLREDNHPLKPDPYISPEPWEELLGASFKKTDITFELIWPTLQPDGSVKDTVNTQVLYLGDLGESVS